MDAGGTRAEQIAAVADRMLADPTLPPGVRAQWQKVRATAEASLLVKAALAKKRAAASPAVQDPQRGQSNQSAQEPPARPANDP